MLLNRSFTVIFISLMLCNLAFGSTMLYKKTNEKKFEADLVPVSSTVIPLTVLEVSYGAGGKPSEEYKMNYLRKLIKKVQLQSNENKRGEAHVEEATESADTLITVKKKISA